MRKNKHLVFLYIQYKLVYNFNSVIYWEQRMRAQAKLTLNLEQFKNCFFLCKAPLASYFL